MGSSQQTEHLARAEGRRMEQACRARDDDLLELAATDRCQRARDESVEVCVGPVGDRPELRRGLRACTLCGRRRRARAAEERAKLAFSGRATRALPDERGPGAIALAHDQQPGEDQTTRRKAAPGDPGGGVMPEGEASHQQRTALGRRRVTSDGEPREQLVGRRLRPDEAERARHLDGAGDADSDDRDVCSGLLPDDPQTRSIFRIEIRDPGDPSNMPPASSIEAAERPLTQLANKAIAAGRKGGQSDHAGVILEPYRNYRGARVIGAWKWLSAYSFGVATDTYCLCSYDAFVIACQHDSAYDASVGAQAPTVVELEVIEA